jgi:predicted phosphodiesterase
MKIQLMSDLHFECYRDRGLDFIDSLDPTNVDVLILAGDIIATNNYDTLLDVFKQFCQKYPYVIFVPGNHEYYGSSVYRKENEFMRVRFTISNLHILNSAGNVTINGQRFIGGTMWFEEDPKNEPYKKYLNDFVHIENFEPWVYTRNQVFEERLTDTLTSDDIVITHHLPSDKSVPFIYKGDPVNAFFLHDMEWLIKDKQPKLWIHGHTHDSFDYFIDKTRILCNPKGYPSDKSTYKNLIIDV